MPGESQQEVEALEDDSASQQLGDNVQGTTTGRILQDVAPEIFTLILTELGWTEEELLAWDHDGTLGTCGLMQIRQDFVLPEPITTQNSLESVLSALDLGVHGDLGPLQVDLRDAPAFSPPAAAHLYRALKKLLPEWILTVGSGIEVIDLPKGLPDVELQAPFGPSPVVDLTLGAKNDTYDGLFWRASDGHDFFEQVVRWAASTVYHHRALVTELDPLQLGTTPFFLSTGLAELSCPYSESLIEEYLLGRSIGVRDSVDGLCESADWELVAATDGSFSFQRPVGFQDDGKFYAYNPPDNPHVVLCGTNAGNAAATDFLFYFATRLFDAAHDCDAPWAMLMATLAARAGLAEILDVAATIVHEIGHEEMYSHCDAGCCQNVVQGWFLHRLLAKYGCPRPTGGNVAPGLPTDVVTDTRWSLERWSMSDDGSTNCKADRFVVSGTHCSLLGLEHAVRVRFTWSEDSTGASCPPVPGLVPLVLPLPLTLRRVEIPDGAATCFS